VEHDCPQRFRNSVHLRFARRLGGTSAFVSGKSPWSRLLDNLRGGGLADRVLPGIAYYMGISVRRVKPA